MAARSGIIDLHEQIDLRNVECLNQASEHPVSHCLENGLRDDDAVFLQSDCDEQLIISIPLKQPCRVHSIQIRAPSDGRGPRRIKLFANALNLDFDGASSTTPAQEIELTESQLDGRSLELKFVRFQRVDNLTIFVEDNQSGGEVTAIQRLSILGDSIHKTNMSELKPSG